MRKCPTANRYEYITTYEDNLALIKKDPKVFIAQLEPSSYNCKLKSSRLLNFHLGCGFKRDSADTICMDHGKYILIEMREVCIQHFGTKPE